MDKNLLYRKIPRVDILLEQEETQQLIARYGRACVKTAVQDETEHLREMIKELDANQTVLSQGESAGELAVEQVIEDLQHRIRTRLEVQRIPDMKRVINATGTILHTNLGRAPISRIHAEKLVELMTGYTNLEYNLSEGTRGERYSHFEKLLCKLTGAEAALAVNNNAAAVMLILNSLAKDGEVIVSRGELVEIGGKFRIPDVMEQSGASLVEVGTTNKTHVSDYEQAITEETKAILKVHTSNYQIIGFTESVGSDVLAEVARSREIPVIEDLGSGVLVDLQKFGLTYEPTVQETLKNGVDVVCFSGDKLLGGPQAGIIAGRKKYIDKIKKNQLTRALRIDKFTAAALELVLQEYLSEEKAVQNIPVLKMIRESEEQVGNRAAILCKKLQDISDKAVIGLESCDSKAGGGSFPLERLPSMAVTVSPIEIRVEKLEERMRNCKVPIIARTANDKIYMDVRTIETEQFDVLVEMLGVCLS